MIARCRSIKGGEYLILPNPVAFHDELDQRIVQQSLNRAGATHVGPRSWTIFTMHAIAAGVRIFALIFVSAPRLPPPVVRLGIFRGLALAVDRV
jgi:hypothetical protein